MHNNRSFAPLARPSWPHATWLCCALLACGSAPPPAPASASEATADAEPNDQGPVLGPALTPSERPASPSATATDPEAETPVPERFPAARELELPLGPRLPQGVGAEARQAFEDAERNGDDRALANLAKRQPALADFITLARLRLRAEREGWPTQLGAGDKDARVRAALSTLEALTKRVSGSEVRAPFVLELGRWLLVSGRYEDALVPLADASTLLPEHAEALSLLAFARLANGQVREALAPMERAVALDLGSAERWGNVGTVRMLNGKVNEAARAYEARVRLAPSSAQARTDYGVALVQIGELTRGVRELQTATELDPNWASYHSNLGYALHRAGRRSESRAAYERALKLDSKLLVGVLGLAALLSENPLDHAEARKLVERARALAPEDPRVLDATRDLAELEAAAKKRP